MSAADRRSVVVPTRQGKLQMKVLVKKETDAEQ